LNGREAREGRFVVNLNSRFGETAFEAYFAGVLFEAVF
jgi:hypothetical protein